MFGHGSDGGIGVQVDVDLSYLIGTGAGFPSKVEKYREDAEDQAYLFAKKEFERVHKDELAALGLQPGDDRINYSGLNDMDEEDLAETFSEYEMEAQNDEIFVFRAGIFYYNDESRSPWVDEYGVPNFFIFLVCELDGRFLPNRTIDLYEETVPFRSTRELKSKLGSAVRKLISKC